MEIEDLANVLYDDNGPSKIGIELNVLDSDGNVESNVYDVFEFLLNLLVIGIKQKNLEVHPNNIGYIELKMQHYFKRININVSIAIEAIHDTSTYASTYASTDPYCTLIYDANTKTMSIVPHISFIKHNTKNANIGLEDLFAVHTIATHCNVSISFGFAF
jgi:hypothetical protein